jgi:hypothetical protein
VYATRCRISRWRKAAIALALEGASGSGDSWKGSGDRRQAPSRP